MSVVTVAAMVVILTIGIGIGWGFQSTVVQSSTGNVTTSQSTTQSQAQGPYMLTLVETMQNMWNSSVGMQPKFFVLGSHGLESSADISLPVNRLIEITIVSYDTPDPAATKADGMVSGTVGGTMYLMNGTIATGAVSIPGPMASEWGQNVTAVPASQVAHTFTIQQLGINIPVVGGSTVIAYVEIHQAGSFMWVCLTPCGAGADGLSGAMSTRGWMTGNIEVS